MSRREIIEHHYALLAQSIAADERRRGGARGTAAMQEKQESAVQRRLQRLLGKDRPVELGSADPNVVAEAIASRVHRYRILDLQHGVAQGIEEIFSAIHRRTLKLNQAQCNNGTSWDLHFVSSIARIFLLLSRAPNEATIKYAKDIKESGRRFAGESDSAADYKQFQRNVWQQILRVEAQNGASEHAASDDEDEDPSDEWSEASTSGTDTSNHKDRMQSDEILVEEVKKRAALRKDLATRIETRRQELANERKILLDEHASKRRELVSYLHSFEKASDEPMLETEIIREVLLALDGLPSRLFALEDAQGTKSRFVPTLEEVHTTQYDEQTFKFISKEVAECATVLHQLKSFVDRHLDAGRQALRTSLDLSLQALSGQIEESLANASTERVEWDEAAIELEPHQGADASTRVLSLSRFLRDLSRQMAPFRSLHEALSAASCFDNVPSIDLPTLLESLQRALSLALAVEVTGPKESSALLARCLVATFTPLWTEMCEWIMNGAETAGVSKAAAGMQRSQDQTTLFAARRSDIAIRDPSFWKVGIETRSLLALPPWLARVSEHVVKASKCVLLLRSLGLSDGIANINWTLWKCEDEQSSSSIGTNAVSSTKKQWTLFPDRNQQPRTNVNPCKTSNATAIEMATTLVDLVEKKTVAASLILERKLTEVLMHPSQNFNLPFHLRAIHGLFLWMQGDVVGEWAEIDFECKEKGASATDLQDYLSNLPSTRDWIDPDLIHSAQNWTIKDAKGAVTAGRRYVYAPPWPLNYIFTEDVMQTYQGVFSLILSVERAHCTMKQFATGRPAVLTSIMDEAQSVSTFASRDLSLQDSTAASQVMARHALLVLSGDTLEARRLHQFKRQSICIIGLLRSHMRRDTISMLAAELQREMLDLVGLDALISLHSTKLYRIAHLVFAPASHVCDEDRLVAESVAGASRALQGLFKLFADASDTLADCHLIASVSEKGEVTTRSRDSDSASDDEGMAEDHVAITKEHGDGLRDASVAFADAQQDPSTASFDQSKSCASPVPALPSPRPQDNVERWLSMLERRLLQCLVELRQYVSALVRHATRLHDEDLRERFAALYDRLDEVTLPRSTGVGVLSRLHR